MLVLDQREKIRILQLEIEKKNLRFKDFKIELYQDLPTDALARRQEMKEITKLNGGKNILQMELRGTLLLFYKGDCLTVLIVQAGWVLAEKLGLVKMEEETPEAAKRWLELSSLREKTIKIPTRQNN